MRVQMTKSTRVEKLAATYEAGSVYEIPDQYGRELISDGAAIECGANNEPGTMRQPTSPRPAQPTGDKK